MRRDYEQLCTEVEYILRKRIIDQGIEVSSVTSRAKTLNSFLEKLQRKHYDAPFDQLTDLAGTRVVCLYHSDIAKIVEILRSEFAIVEDIDKLDELGVDQFGYGARHLIVQLGKSSSGARYDDLKHLSCEVQVRTVVQDAWAIIQHHMVYKRESQVPSKLQRKLNSLAGLFETVDDQFERIREEREEYVAEVRDSANKPSAFLENELNLDSFKEYLLWRFPDQTPEAFDGQASIIVDALVTFGYKSLGEVEDIIKSTVVPRAAILRELMEMKILALPEDGTPPSAVEPFFALALSSPDWEKMRINSTTKEVVRKHRAELIK